MPEETKQLLRDGIAELHAVRGEIHALRRRLRLTSVGVVLVGAVLLGSVFVIYRDRQFRGCMSGWARQFTDRSLHLSRPGNARIDLFFQAYTEAAGDVPGRLDKVQRAGIIAALDADRKTYKVLPTHAKLETVTDFQLLAFRDLVAALRANDAYQHANAAYPLPTAPTCGGIF